MIVLTAPTGLIGRQVLKNVLASGEAVRIIVRDPSKLPADVRGRVEVVQGSHGDAAIVNKAFAGADTVFWLAPGDPQASSVMAAYRLQPAGLRGLPKPKCQTGRRNLGFGPRSQ